MDQQHGRTPAATGQHTPNRDETFQRHGPEPPENDSGPSPNVEEINRGGDGADDEEDDVDPYDGLTNVSPDQLVD